MWQGREAQATQQTKESKRKYIMSLQKFLATLNSADSQHGVWVNPDNYNDYRIGDFSWENGGLPPKYICIGSLENLSFGFQSKRDAIKHLLSENDYLLYKGKKVKISVEGTLEAYCEGNLDEDFSAFLDEKAEEIENIWAENEAEEFVIHDIPDMIQQALEDAAEYETKNT